MGNYKISSAMRYFFLFTGSITWLGIWLTGFSLVRWLLYVPPTLFYFAALTGICPGLLLWRRVLPEKA